MDNIKHGLRTKPPRQRGPNSLIRKSGIRILNLDRLATSPRRSSVRQKLRIAALLQTDKPEDGFLDRAADRQEAVIL